MAGIRNTVPLADLEQIDKAAYDELLRIMEMLEQHYKDLCDIEFTIEHGKLWMLQTRVGKRTAGAAFTIAGAARRPGPDRPRRGGGPGHRGPARAADVPALRRDRRAHAAGQGHERLAGRRGRQGGLRLRRGRRVGGPGRGRGAGAPRDQPRRPQGHGRGQGHPDQPRRQDLARGRGRARHGPDLCLRRRLPGRGREGEAVHHRRRHGRLRGRRDLHRRHHRRGVRGRRTRRRLRAGPLVRRRRQRQGRPAGAGRGPADGARRRDPPAAGARQRGHPGGRGPGPALRRPGDRAVPHRAHVPRRPPRARGAADPGRGDRRAGGGAGTSCCRCSARTSSRSSRRWTGCRSRSG